MRRIAFPSLIGIKSRVHLAVHRRGVFPFNCDIDVVLVPHGSGFGGIGVAYRRVCKRPVAAGPIPFVEFAVDGHLRQLRHANEPLVLALAADHVVTGKRVGGPEDAQQQAGRPGRKLRSGHVTLRDFEEEKNVAVLY